MKNPAIILTPLFGILASSLSPAADQQVQDEAPVEVGARNKPEHVEEFRNQALGMFIHWSVDYLFIDGQPDGIRDLAWELQPDTLVTREGNQWFVRSSTDPKTVYVFLTRIAPEEWEFGKRKQFVLKSVRSTGSTTVSVLGHGGEVVEYMPKADPTPRFAQKEDGLHLDLMKAQRIYNLTRGPHSWPNPMVVKLTGVEPAAP